MEWQSKGNERKSRTEGIAAVIFALDCPVRAAQTWGRNHSTSTRTIAVSIRACSHAACQSADRGVHMG